MFCFRDWKELFEGLAETRKSHESLLEELRRMSQAINDRFDQVDAAIETEKTEIAAEIQALRDEIAKGAVNEAQMLERLDGIKARVTGMHTPAQGPGSTEPIP